MNYVKKFQCKKKKKYRNSYKENYKLPKLILYILTLIV